MIKYEEIRDTKDFYELDLDEGLMIVNELLSEGYTQKAICESIGANKTYISTHLKRRGYTLDQSINQFVPMTEENKPQELKKKEAKKNIPTKKKEPTGAKIEANTGMSPAQLYGEFHTILHDVDTSEYIRTSMSFAKCTNEKLNEFLKVYKLLDKQDVITVALEMFLEKYK